MKLENATTTNRRKPIVQHYTHTLSHNDYTTISSNKGWCNTIGDVISKNKGNFKNRNNAIKTQITIDALPLLIKNPRVTVYNTTEKYLQF